MRAEIYVLITEEGEYICSHDLENLGSLLVEHYNPNEAIQRRLIKVTLNVPDFPSVELQADVAQLDDKCSVQVN